jgi:hypothetical protein
MLLHQMLRMTMGYVEKIMKVLDLSGIDNEMVGYMLCLLIMITVYCLVVALSFSNLSFV